MLLQFVSIHNNFTPFALLYNQNSDAEHREKNCIFYNRSVSPLVNQSRDIIFKCQSPSTSHSRLPVQTDCWQYSYFLSFRTDICCRSGYFFCCCWISQNSTQCINSCRDACQGLDVAKTSVLIARTVSHQSRRLWWHLKTRVCFVYSYFSTFYFRIKLHMEVRFLKYLMQFKFTTQFNLN